MVVAASVTMERAAAALGNRFAIPEIVVGGLVLAAVTSLPNAVAAVYLAAQGRGAATLSTALNSNNLNVTIGLLIPAALIGLGQPTSQTTLIATWYIALTGVVLAFAYRDHGIRRYVGVLIIAAYVVFAGSLLVSAYAPHTRYSDRDRGRRRGGGHRRCPPGTRAPPRSRRARNRSCTCAIRQRT